MLTARAQGESGGSKFNVSVDRSDALAPLTTGQLMATVNIRNNAAQTLLGQMGIELLPIDLAGPAAVDLRVEGVPAEHLEFAFDYETPGTSTNATGTAGRTRIGSFRVPLI